MSGITSEDLKILMALFDASDWREMSLQTDDVKLFLSRDSQAGGLNSASVRPQLAAVVSTSTLAEPAAATAGTASPVGAQPAPEGSIVIAAPNLGIFYRSPKPGAAPYVQLGDRVEEDTEVCLIEVMKLFTPVFAGTKGILRQVCIEDGDMVEFDQPLFYIEPVA